MDLEFKYNILLQCVEAALFIGLGVWCLKHRAESSWAALTAVGTLLFGAILAIYGLLAFESAFLDSHQLWDLLSSNDHLGTLFGTVRVVGAAMLVVGFVQSRRTPPAASGSIYGS